MLAIYRKDALEGGERYREDYDFDLESSALELRGGVRDAGEKDEDTDDFFFQTFWWGGVA